MADILISEFKKRDDWFADFMISAILSLLAAIIFVVSSSRLFHWFALPVTFCSMVIGIDAVKWFRGKYELFDPKGIIGILGVHFFFISPILVVLWEIQTPLTAVTLEDYRPWLGMMGILNFFGLLFYQFTQSLVTKRPHKPLIKIWTPNPSRIVPVLFVFIGLTLAAQIYMFAVQGILGVVSWSEADFEARLGGKGVFRMLTKSLPILLLILFTMLKSRMSFRRSNIIVVAFFVLLVITLAFISGGLAGSRSATVWVLFWMVGVIHYFWRPLSRKIVISGLIFLVFFMYVYGFYKHLGTRAWEVFQTGGVEALSAETGSTMRGMLIGDLSRANIQAYMAYVLIDKPYPYQYRYGKTLIGDFLVQFPRWIIKNRYNIYGDPGKMIAGTDIINGPGFYDPIEVWRKARFVYGLAGQAMLNFGVLSVPFAFIIWGAAVGWYRRHFFTWPAGDMRFFLAPLLVSLLFNILTSDMDNIFSFLIFESLIPFTAVWLISYRHFETSVGDEQDEYSANISFDSE